MGRPLSKQRYFGANERNNIKVQFNNGSASVRGYIVKQMGSKKFRCKDQNGVEATCFLVAKSSSSLLPGEMSITVLTDSQQAYQVTKIANKKLSFAGVSRPWTFLEDSNDNYVQIEEVGSNSSFLGSNDFEGDDLFIPAGMDRDEPLAGSGGANNTVPGNLQPGFAFVPAYSATGITFRDIRPSGVDTVPNMASGLIRKKYVGNFSEDYVHETIPPFSFDINFFNSSQGAISTPELEIDTYIGFGARTDLSAENNYAFEWKGYLRAPVTGNMQFFATVDDDCVVWMGFPALAPSTGNYLFAQTGDAVGESAERRNGSDGITVVANKYYPIRLWFQEWGGAEKFLFGANNSVNSTLYGLTTGSTPFVVAHNSATRGF